MGSGALQRRLRAGEFAITAEITPPLSADPQELMDRALPLRGHADAVNVTDGASARAPGYADGGGIAGAQRLGAGTAADLS